MKFRGALAAILFVSGCGVSTEHPDTEITASSPADILSGCCDRAGSYPDWVIKLADDNAQTVRRLGQIQLRPGHLTRQPKALERVQNALKPLDVVFLHSANRVSGHLIPGEFTHGVVYLGTPDQLRAAGLWNLPALAPWRREISAGAIFLEAVYGGVRLTRADVVLDSDAVVALRPRGMRPAAALSRGMERIGVPFDLRFDAADSSALFCAELIALMFPKADLPRTAVPGRETILNDAIIADALSGNLPFSVVGYVKATAGGGARVLSAHDLAWDVRRAWPGVERSDAARSVHPGSRRHSP